MIRQLARAAASSMLRAPSALPSPLTPFSSCGSTSLTRALATRRKLPASVVVTDDASSRIAALLGTQTEVLGVRIGVTNDWGSPSGFSYTLNFVQPGDLQKSDERIELADGAVLFVERKALWSGEGGLLGATLDLDENFNIIITKPDKNPT